MVPPLLARSPASHEAVFPSPDDGIHDLAASLLLQDTEKFAQEFHDHEQSETEMREDLNRLTHDQKFGNEIMGISEDWWEKYGDNYHKPYEVGCSSSSSKGNESNITAYIKGLVSEERVRDERVVVAGVGVAICDIHLVFEVKKALAGDEMLSSELAGLEALLDGLNVALELGLETVTYLCDDALLYHRVTNAQAPQSSKIATLVNKIALLCRKFKHYTPVLVGQKDMKFAFKLARDAIVTQIIWPADTSRGKCLRETCIVCYEDTDTCQMFSVVGCLHRFCFPCMKRHVEAKLYTGTMVKCPHEDCEHEVDIHSCGKVLEPELYEILTRRTREASIAVTEKVYCPYPRCSALTSKSEALEHTNGVTVGAEQSGVRKCIKCHYVFCINCMVPWHSNMTCAAYKMSHPHPLAQDDLLKNLARKKLRRQCENCNYMVELANGCYHITCRYGHEFCYTCGADWKNKKPTSPPVDAQSGMSATLFEAFIVDHTIFVNLLF